MKRTIGVPLLAVLVAQANIQAQNSGNAPASVFDEPGFSRALAVAPTDAEAHEGGGGGGGEEKDETTGLAKAAQNPVADLISVPFQNNFNFGIGPNKVTQYDMNFQPVIPLHLSDEWNLITRTIVPVINQPSPASGFPSAFGLGDINPTFFLSPAKPSHFIWGAGPTFTFPTATSSILGSGKYSAGPAVVVVIDSGHWLGGALVNNQWSYAGWRNRNVNEMLIQPFVNYNFSHGWYVTASPIITADWMAEDPNRWVVPVGGGVGRIVKLGGKLPINLQVSGYYNMITPEDFGAKWQLRAQLTFLFPTKKK